MNNCCNNCRPSDQALKKQVADLEKLLEENGLKDGNQDALITQLFNMYRCNVAQAVTDYMEVLKDSGELNQLLTEMAESLKPYMDVNVVTAKGIDTATGTDYYVTYVPAKDGKGQPIPWKVGIADDAYDGVGLNSTIEFAHWKNATVAINAGVFNVDTGAPIGCLIKDGRIVQSALPGDEKYQYLAIMADGSFKNYPQTTSAGQMINEGVVDAICIFTTLIENGVAVEQTDDRLEPRQSIGVDAAGRVVIITCDGRKPGEDNGMSYADMARLHAAHGCVNAWALDGGGSASTVVHGVKINDNIDYLTNDRYVNTFLYFGKDTTLSAQNRATVDLGKAQQRVLEAIYELKNFYRGFICLRGPENYYAPGIEMYVNAEEKRRAKVGVNIDKDEIENSYGYFSFRPEDTELYDLFRIYRRGAYIQTYHGPSSDRPNGPIGLQYFDETLGKPIWRKSTTQWVDATGAIV